MVGVTPKDPLRQQFAGAIVHALKPYDVVRVVERDQPGAGLRIQVRLSDGHRVIVDARRVNMPVSTWVIRVLVVQLIVLALCAWVAVRLVTRPLAQLASAADRLGPNLKGPLLAEVGPTEVVRATRAFNAMQQRIAGYMAERVEILATISHHL